jgi:hypothetical protein
MYTVYYYDDLSLSCLLFSSKDRLSCKAVVVVKIAVIVVIA